MFPAAHKSIFYLGPANKRVPEQRLVVRRPAFSRRRQVCSYRRVCPVHYQWIVCSTADVAEPCASLVAPAVTRLLDLNEIALRSFALRRCGGHLALSRFPSVADKRQGGWAAQKSLAEVFFGGAIGSQILRTDSWARRGQVLFRRVQNTTERRKTDRSGAPWKRSG
jgi:hypothetical protein